VEFRRGGGIAKRATRSRQTQSLTIPRRKPYLHLVAGVLPTIPKLDKSCGFFRNE
jgi:hypothetical protein